MHHGGRGSAVDGAAFVAALAFATPRLGLAVTLTMAIWGAGFVTALALDRWGLLGLSPQPIGWAAGGLVWAPSAALIRRA
ncbi:DMT family transporter [Sphingomonas sp. MMS24-JH45]